MPEISKVANLSELRSTTLRKRAERGHSARSCEFLASVHGEEAGLLSYEDWSDRESGFIYEIFVLPSFRRRGVGESLLYCAQRYALQLGCTSVRLKPYALDQQPDKSRLIAWYTRAGYHPTTDDPEYMEKRTLA
jgi:GNAT superfamily N-acetyltransferase